MIDIPYGSVVSWRLPLDEVQGYQKVFNWLQLKATKRPETHSSFILDRVMYFNEENELVKENKYYEYEASTSTRVNNNFVPNKNCSIFRINAPRYVLEIAATVLIREHNGKIYNLPQTIYFLFRWFMEEFNVDVRRWYNPLGFFFLICSELVYLFLYKVAMLMKWDETIKFLEQWRKDTVHSGDIREILNFMTLNNRAQLILGV